MKPVSALQGGAFVLIICFIYVLCLSCFRVWSLLPCSHCWEMADLLALVCDVYDCDFVAFYVVSWVRCGT